MKHALIDEENMIERIVPNATNETVEITDEQAAVVEAGLSTRARYHWINGELVTSAAYHAQKKAAYFAAHPELAKPRRATKLTLMRRLDALGKWELFKAILAQLPEVVQDAWTLAQDVDESDPLFAANKETLMTALGITEAELCSLFAE